MKTLKNITGWLFVICFLLNFIYLGIQKFTLDHLTEIHFLKLFYKDFLLMIFCGIISSLILESNE